MKLIFIYRKKVFKIVHISEYLLNFRKLLINLNSWIFGIKQHTTISLFTHTPGTLSLTAGKSYILRARSEDTGFSFWPCCLLPVWPQIWSCTVLVSQDFFLPQDVMRFSEKGGIKVITLGGKKKERYSTDSF